MIVYKVSAKNIRLNKPAKLVWRVSHGDDQISLRLLKWPPSSCTYTRVYYGRKCGKTIDYTLYIPKHLEKKLVRMLNIAMTLVSKVLKIILLSFVIYLNHNDMLIIVSKVVVFCWLHFISKFWIWLTPSTIISIQDLLVKINALLHPFQNNKRRWLYSE